MTPQFKRNVLSVIGLAVFVFFAAATSNLKDVQNRNGNVNSTSPTHAADVTTYTNSSQKFSGTLQENYVDFSFDYPNTWKRDENAGKGDSPNFVKVERATDDKITTENFAVGYFTGQKDAMPQLANQLSQQFSGGFPEYKKVSEGETHVGSYDGYEFRFTAHAKDTPNGDLDIWGRAVLLPGGDDRKGAVLIMLATSASDAVKSVNDVGETGELPLILNSFRFGKG
ncbi:MAG: hypothetical protein ABR555_10980 [Pyrinomonadaceae bacterium]